MAEPVSQCRLQSIRVKKGEVWFKKEEVTTIIYLFDIIVLYKKVYGSWLTLFMMSPLMFGIGISLSTSSSMSKTMAIACRRYKGEREAGCEQVIFYFIKYLRHWIDKYFYLFPIVYKTMVAAHLPSSIFAIVPDIRACGNGIVCCGFERKWGSRERKR